MIEKGTVVIDGHSLAFVGPDARLRFSKQDTMFDISGKTVLPGFIDTHVHLCMDGTPDPVASFSKEPVPTTTLKAARHARLTLEAGITTIRDLGGKDFIDIAIRDAIDSELIPGPRVICSGKMICMTGGHGWEFGREANGAEDIRKAVREQLKAGADIIKMMATGGIMTKGMNPGSTQFTLEELKAGVQEAQKAGRLTASHAQGTEGIKNSLLAGINSIEHGFFLNDETIRLMLERKAFFVPTLSVNHHILRAGTKSGIPAFAVEKAKSVIKSHEQSVKKAYQAGVQIALGTDAGTPFNQHGKNLKELDLLVQMGFSPMEAIVAGTKTASQVLGLADKIGTLEKGKLADLIIIDGNPLEDIGLLQEKDRILAIMKGGRFLYCRVEKGGEVTKLD